MLKYLWCDPPFGQHYGWPKVLCEMPEEAKSFDKALADKIHSAYEKQLELYGYPVKHIPFALAHSRFWIVEEKDSENTSDHTG